MAERAATHVYVPTISVFVSLATDNMLVCVYMAALNFQWHDGPRIIWCNYMPFVSDTDKPIQTKSTTHGVDKHHDRPNISGYKNAHTVKLAEVATWVCKNSFLQQCYPAFCGFKPEF